MTTRTSSKNCPRCGSPLDIKVDEDGKEYLGCSDYPECAYTEPLPIDAILRRQGSPGLPGF